MNERMKLSVPYPQGLETKTGLTTSSDGNSRRSDQVGTGTHHPARSNTWYAMQSGFRATASQRVWWFGSDFLQVRMSNSVTFFFPNKDLAKKLACCSFIFTSYFTFCRD